MSKLCDDVKILQLTGTIEVLQRSLFYGFIASETSDHVVDNVWVFDFTR